MSAEPRLMTIDQAAAYLAIPMAELRRLGIGRVHLGTKVRFDRVALDAHLDALRGVTPGSSNDDEAEAALARFNQRGSNAPRRA